MKNEDNSVNSSWSWKWKNNTYRKETFNVINTSIVRTAGLCKFTLLLQGGPEIRTVIFCLWGSMDNSFQMSLWNLQNERYRWRRIPYVTKNHHHHHHYQPHYHNHHDLKNLQHLLQITCCVWYRLGWRLFHRQQRRWIQQKLFW